MEYTDDNCVLWDCPGCGTEQESWLGINNNVPYYYCRKCSKTFRKEVIENAQKKV